MRSSKKAALGNRGGFFFCPQTDLVFYYQFKFCSGEGLNPVKSRGQDQNTAVFFSATCTVFLEL